MTAPASGSALDATVETTSGPVAGPQPEATEEAGDGLEQQ